MGSDSTTVPEVLVTTDGQSPQTGAEPDEFVIRARKGWIPLDWAELVHYRELLYFLIWRDVKVRYKQTLLGVAWAVLQPVFGMVVFTIIFGNFAKIPSDGMPYAVFVYAGLLPWTFFSNGVSQAGQSLISQQNLLTKIYFPRLFVPAAAIGVALVDLAISFAVMAGIMAWYRVMPGWGVLWLPLLVILTTLAGLGIGLVLAALTVTYRDVRFVIPFMMQAWMYLSPVVYPVTMVPEKYRWALALNPMAGIIDGYRSAILGTPWKPGTLAISSAVAMAVFVFGLYYFKKTERRFADIV